MFKGSRTVFIPMASVAILSMYSLSSYAGSDGNESNPLDAITVIGSQAVEKAEIGGTPVKDLPMNVHVVGEDEVERLRFVDPNELLDRIPGETQVRNLRIPDGGKGYTIPMVDGIPLESPYEGATQRIDRVNTADIQRVEVIKGPASAIYPSNALGGVINVVTKEAPIKPEGEIWYEGGDFNRRRFGVNTGGTAGKVGYFIDINSRSLDGLRDDVKNDRDQFSGKFIFDATETTRIVTRVERLEEDVVTRADLTEAEIAENPRQSGGNDSSEDLSQDAFFVKLEQLFDSSNLDVSFSYREKDTIGTSRFSGPQNENDEGINTKVLYRYDFDNSNLITGFENYTGKQHTLQYARNDGALSGPFDTIDSELDINAYFAQYEFRPAQRLGITLGVRHENIDIKSFSDNANDSSGSASFNDTSPKLGFTYDLSANNRLWLSLSEGFYAPDISDIIGDPSEPATINLGLAPEESTNIEVGLRGSSGSWSYDTSYYHTEIENYLVTQEFQNGLGQDVERTTNAGQVTVQGVESVLEYAPKGAQWRMGFTHTYARNIYDSFVSSDGDFSGNELRRSPKHHFNARVAWLPIQKLTVELEGDFYSSYFGDNANSPEGRFTRDERIHLRIDYAVDSWEFWLHGLNLTDTLEDRATFSRGELKFRTIDGRTFYAGAAYQF
jgi:outer membrane receptor protein involved in Fe transport